MTTPHVHLCTDLFLLQQELEVPSPEGLHLGLQTCQLSTVGNSCVPMNISSTVNSELNTQDHNVLARHCSEVPVKMYTRKDRNPGDVASSEGLGRQ